MGERVCSRGGRGKGEVSFGKRNERSSIVLGVY